MSLLLAALVALGLALTARFWLHDPYTSAPVAVPPYLTADATARSDPAALLAPWQIVVATQGAAMVLGDPADPRFQAIWSNALTVLHQIGAPQLGAASRATRADVVAALGAGAPVVEIQFGSRLTWAERWSALFGRGWPGSTDAGAAASDLLLAPGSGSTTVYLVDGSSVLRVALPAAAGRRIGHYLASLRPPVGADEVRPLTGGTGGVRVLPGVLVPVSDYEPGPVSVRPEPINVTALTRAAFADPAIVGQAVLGDGARFFTNGTDGLRLAPDGSVSWSAPAVPATPGRSWLASFESADRFVARLGGWPKTAVLQQARPYAAAGGPEPSAAPAEFSFAFAVRQQGLPVLGRPPVLTVVAGAFGVSAARRLVPVATAPGAAERWLPPSVALDSLAAHWPPALAGSPRAVADVFPCFFYPGGNALVPAWAFVLADGQIALVDAADATVLGTPGAPS